MLTQARLKEMLHYDPETGVFTRCTSRNRWPAGTQAGTLGDEGYLIITIDGSLYKAHRLAWFYVHGYWPKYQIDHIDRVSINNKFSNLREATPKQNAENKGINSNNTSGFQGVNFHKENSKWKAQINHHGKKVHLGYYNTPEEASAAYEAARDKLFTYHKKEEQNETTFI